MTQADWKMRIGTGECARGVGSGVGQFGGKAGLGPLKPQTDPHPVFLPGEGQARLLISLALIALALIDLAYFSTLHDPTRAE